MSVYIPFEFFGEGRAERLLLDSGTSSAFRGALGETCLETGIEAVNPDPVADEGVALSISAPWTDRECKLRPSEVRISAARMPNERAFLPRAEPRIGRG